MLDMTDTVAASPAPGGDRGPALVGSPPMVPYAFATPDGPRAARKRKQVQLKLDSEAKQELAAARLAVRCAVAVVGRQDARG